MTKRGTGSASDLVRLARQLFLGLFVQGMIYIRGLIMLPLVIKLAGETVYGASVLLGSLVTFLFGVSAFGARYSYWRGLPAAASNAERKALLMPQLWFQTGVVILCCIGIFATASFTGNKLLGASPLPICAWLVSLLLLAQGSDYFRYTQRFGIFNLSSVAHLYLYVGAVIAVAIAGTPLTLDLLIGLQATALMIVAVPMVLAMLRETGFGWPRQPRREFVRQAWQGLPLTIEFVLDIVMVAGDRYLVAIFLSIEAVGQYQPAYQLAFLLSFLPKYMGVVLPPALSRFVDGDDLPRARALFDNAMRIFLMLSIPFVIGCAMVGPSVLALLTTPAIAEASRLVLPLVALGMLFYGIMVMITYLAFVLGRTREILTANLIAIGTSLGLATLMLPIWPSIVVPAAAALIGYAISAGYAIRFARRHWPIDWKPLLLLRCVVSALVMALLLAGLGFGVGQPAAISMVVLIAAIPGAILTYFLVLAAIGGVDREAVTLVRTLARRNP